MKSKILFYHHLLSIQEIVSLFQNRDYRFNVRLFHSWVSKDVIPKTFDGYFFPDIIEHIESIFAQRGRGYTLAEIREALEEEYKDYCITIAREHFHKDEYMLYINDDLVGEQRNKFPVDPDGFRAWIKPRGLLTPAQVQSIYLMNAVQYLVASYFGADATANFVHRFEKKFNNKLSHNIRLYLHDECNAFLMIPEACLALHECREKFLTNQLKKAFKLRKGLGLKVDSLKTYIGKGLVLVKESNIIHKAFQDRDELIRRLTNPPELPKKAE